MQLDLFTDSRDVLLRNDTIAALRVRNTSAAHAAYAKLAFEYPCDRFLHPLATLLDSLDTSTSALTDVQTDVQTATTALERMQLHQAAALQLFGANEAQSWLTPLWRGLAERVASLPFSAESPSVYSAAIWLQARDWAAAEVAVGAIPAWRRHPQSLAWMAEARHASHGLAVAWPLLVELAWLAPTRLVQLVPRLNTPVLSHLLHAFQRDFDAEKDSDLAWFPAWALVAEPGLAHVLRPSEATRGTPPERAFQLMLQLLDLERQGRHADLVECRKRLRDLHAELFNCYMSTR
jgi:hypothetical protein